MSMLETKLAAVGAALVLGAAVALAQPPGSARAPGLGKPISEADIEAWNIDVAPSGKGLPRGSGTSAQGAAIYAEKCAACHRPDLTGYASPGAGPLVGAPSLADGIETDVTIANRYRHPTTLFDVIRRTMPFHAPRSLTNDEVYALTAYILAANKIIPANQAIDAKTLPKVKMPAADVFIIRFPDRT